MRTRRHRSASTRPRGHPVSALLEIVRDRSRRSRNLAELAALDADRLQDIGLTKATRARIVCPG
ncbi:MAG: DUF1127 domain-containing protein [Kiloniellales bacterium]